MTTEPELFVPPQLPNEKGVRILYALLDQIIFVLGKRGRGKTTTMVAMAYWFRELFDKRIITVATDLGIRDVFGPYTYLSIEDFRKQLILLDEFARDPASAALEGDALEQALYKKGVIIYKAALFWDEAYKLTSARKPMDPMVQAIDTFVAQSRHYKVTLVLSSLALREIDWKIRDQVDWKAAPFFNKMTDRITVTFKRDADMAKMKWHIPASRYWPLFYSWNLLGYAGHRFVTRGQESQESQES